MADLFHLDLQVHVHDSHEPLLRVDFMPQKFSPLNARLPSLAPSVPPEGKKKELLEGVSFHLISNMINHSLREPISLH